MRLRLKTKVNRSKKNLALGMFSTTTLVQGKSSRRTENIGGMSAKCHCHVKKKKCSRHFLSLRICHIFQRTCSTQKTRVNLLNARKFILGKEQQQNRMGRFSSLITFAFNSLNIFFITWQML